MKISTTMASIGIRAAQSAVECKKLESIRLNIAGSTLTRTHMFEYTSQTEIPRNLRCIVHTLLDPHITVGILCRL